MTRKTIRWGAAILTIAVLCGGGWFWLRRSAAKKADVTTYNDIIEHEDAGPLAEDDGILDSSRPAWERLQKGIYYQETAGDFDRAIKIYRLIEAMPYLGCASIENCALPTGTHCIQWIDGNSVR